MVDRSGPTGVPRSPIRWQLPHRIRLRPEQPLAPARVALEGEDGPGPGVRAELPLLPVVRRQIALEEVADRAVRELRRPRPATRPARRRPARRGRASAPATAPTSGWLTKGRAVRRPGSGPGSSPPVHPGDPSRDQVQARLVGPLGADVRHPIAAELGHAEVQGARIRVARLDDPRRRAARSRRGWGGRRWRSSRRSAPRTAAADRTDPPPPSEVAVAAIGVEVSPGPGLHRLAGSAGSASRRSLGGRRRVERRQRLAVVAGPSDEARLRQRDELVPAVGPGAVQLLGQERQGVLRPVAVARHALAAALERPDSLRLPSWTSFSAPSAGTRSASAWSSRQAYV